MTKDEESCTASDMLQKIREVVDQDITAPSEWYKIILAVRDLVGVTR